VACLRSRWVSSFPLRLQQWVAGFGVGFLWASLFEYAYHRFLLHLPGTFFARRHLEHHASVGTLTEAEHVNFGSSPIWVIVFFAINGVPVIIADLLFGLGMAPGIFLAFACYFITVEEMHWRIHLGERLPPVLRASRAYHLAHHARPTHGSTFSCHCGIRCWDPRGGSFLWPIPISSSDKKCM
jgi:hypothetical protein